MMVEQGAEIQRLLRTARQGDGAIGAKSSMSAWFGRQ